MRQTLVVAIAIIMAIAAAGCGTFWSQQGGSSTIDLQAMIELNKILLADAKAAYETWRDLKDTQAQEARAQDEAAYQRQLERRKDLMKEIESGIDVLIARLRDMQTKQE